MLNYRKSKILSVLILLVLMAACNRANEQPQEPPTIPTVTVLPPFITETPLVTATLTPSITPTPSGTPTLTLTATPVTPTETPTLTPTSPSLGEISFTGNVFVRSEPSYDASQVALVTPGTEVELHWSNDDGTWIFVRLLDDEGRLVEGWVDKRLLDMRGYEAPTQGPTATPTPVFTAGTAAPFVTTTPGGTPGAENGQALEDASDVNVLAYCQQIDVPAPTVRSGQSVSIEWSWYVRQPELMEDHLAHANYDILLNGRRLTNYEQYQLPLRRGSDSRWYVYWYYPVGVLEPGRYEVSYLLTWDEPISDGYSDFGPGTENESNEGKCVFNVVE